MLTIRRMCWWRQCRRHSWVARASFPGWPGSKVIRRWPRCWGSEAIASQSTLSRFFGGGSPRRVGRFWAGCIPVRGIQSAGRCMEATTLDLDSWALLHEDGHQAGEVAVGYTRLGLKPCHRPLIMGLAEAKLIANYWLRSGNTACELGRPSSCARRCKPCPHICASVWCAGTPASAEASVQDTCEEPGLKFGFCGEADAEGAVGSAAMMKGRRGRPPRCRDWRCRKWNWNAPGRRLIVIRQRVQDRPQAGGKTLLWNWRDTAQAAGHQPARCVDGTDRVAALQRSGGFGKPDQGAGR